MTTLLTILLLVGAPVRLLLLPLQAGLPFEKRSPDEIELEHHVHESVTAALPKGSTTVEAKDADRLRKEAFQELECGVELGRRLGPAEKATHALSSSAVLLEKSWAMSVSLVDLKRGVVTGTVNVTGTEREGLATAFAKRAKELVATIAKPAKPRPALSALSTVAGLSFTDARTKERLGEPKSSAPGPFGPTLSFLPLAEADAFALRVFTRRNGKTSGLEIVDGAQPLLPEPLRASVPPVLGVPREAAIAHLGKPDFTEGELVGWWLPDGCGRALLRCGADTCTRLRVFWR